LQEACAPPPPLNHFARVQMFEVTVHFYSYFKDITGCADIVVKVEEGGSLSDIAETISTQFPKLAAMRHATLMAVGVEYQGLDYLVKPGDEVSLFPPVQGG
jgi:molybdopterin converting factor small subunit